ncbi:hypothetical protein NKH18_32590 [Streptomyces sp. M10(2022)]
MTASTADLGSLPSSSPSYVAAHSARIMGGMLDRGFTTVRDASGADYGLCDAQEEGLIRGPRIMFCGRALSQTGGHGDTGAAARASATIIPAVRVSAGWPTASTRYGPRRATSCARVPTTSR